jgi:hypothetical protein
MLGRMYWKYNKSFQVLNNEIVTEFKSAREMSI